METIGNILKQVKFIRREINRLSKIQTSNKAELAENYRQQAAFGRVLTVQAERLANYAANLVGRSNALYFDAKYAAEEEQKQTIIETQTTLPF